MTADVTVVVPTRDRLPLLRRTLAQVRSQRGVDLEVVVVDEASSDGTAEWLHDLARIDPRVRFLRHDEPRGVSAARNHGLEAVTTPWVAFTDDDDLYAPDKLVSQLAALAATPGAGWSTCGAVLVDEQLQVIAMERPEPLTDVAVFALGRNPAPGGGSGVLASTELARAVGGFDETLSMVADWEFWIRLAQGAPVAPVDRPLLAYVVHPGGMSRGASRSRWEFEVIEERYRAMREAAGHAFPLELFLEWMAKMDVRAGLRWTAASLFFEEWRLTRRARPLKRSLAAVGALRFLQRRLELGDLYSITVDWAAEAEPWLAAIREAEVVAVTDGGSPADAPASGPVARA